MESNRGTGRPVKEAGGELRGLGQGLGGGGVEGDFPGVVVSEPRMQTAHQAETGGAVGARMDGHPPGQDRDEVGSGLGALPLTAPGAL